MQIKLLASFIFVATSVVAAAPPVPYFSGFNLGSQRPDGSCKTQGDWEQEFKTIRSWSPNSRALFDTIKIFSTNDCDALARAVPAALNAGMKIWAGVWAVDNAKFEREKGALERALKQYGSKWLIGVNVGSESLYRKEIDPNLLAQYIYDVKGMVQIAYGASHVPVGCADTWTSWVDGANRPVIEASDVIAMNAFPYWEGVNVEAGLQTFQTALQNTRNAVGSKPIVVGETGWPSAGPAHANATPCEDCVQKYYSTTGCWLQQSGTIGWFWFSGFDEPQKFSTIEKNFGIARSDRKLKVNLTCRI
ncbi:glycoside hydrolase superfamily [Kalaharituber pfeilii]|nr:glycoside hydrolase superfamily [Kalaharituber pfeilii]